MIIKTKKRIYQRQPGSGIQRDILPVQHIPSILLYRSVWIFFVTLPEE